MTLQSITNYRAFKTYNREDETGTDSYATYFDTANIENNTSWSQEFRLSGKSRIADWVAGVSYTYEHAQQTAQTNTYTDTVDTVLNNAGVVPGGLYEIPPAPRGRIGITRSACWTAVQESMIDDASSNRWVLRRCDLAH